ncbi:MAG: hypothetical protein IJK04_12395, partial [Kiritimatiellae bacterium]|nr:hypothetical protein [Kiritimatiellia bacterium]
QGAVSGIRPGKGRLGEDRPPRLAADPGKKNITLSSGSEKSAQPLSLTEYATKSPSGFSGSAIESWLSFSIPFTCGFNTVED